jgi:DNA-binding NarL/FixJ family response regulator
MSGVPPKPEEITENMLARAFPALTPCECKVLRWVNCGKTDGEIAVILAIATATVSTHVRNLRGKLQLETRHAAMAEVVREIICRPDRWER